MVGNIVDDSEIKELKERVFELENNWKRALADYKNLQKRFGEEAGKLRTIKKGRPWGQAFVTFMYPDDVIDFWDIDRFHPRYQELQWANKRWRLWEKGPFHIIAPTKVRNPHLDKSLLTKADNTACYFCINNSFIVKIFKYKINPIINHFSLCDFFNASPYK